ncbi:MAG: fibronectin type III domain-containing protein [Desulfobacterales bacterium]
MLHLQSVSQNFSKPFIMIFKIIFFIIVTGIFKPARFLLILGALYLLPLITYASEVTVTWDASGESTTGYKIHYGTKSGDYDNTADVGNFPGCTISGLQAGVTYYFAATAYNDIDESDYSEEISYTVPLIDSTTIYEDAEDGTIYRWRVYDSSPDGATIENVYDDDRQSSVIQFYGSGTQNGYRLYTDDGTTWQNSSQFVIRWSMKYSNNFYVYIDVQTTSGMRYLYYSGSENNGLGSGTYIHHGLGHDVIDGRWHTIVRDLQADLEEAQPGERILEVNGFLIRGSGKVDDISLLDK